MLECNSKARSGMGRKVSKGNCLNCKMLQAQRSVDFGNMFSSCTK